MVDVDNGNVDDHNPQYICTLTRARRIIVSCWVSLDQLNIDKLLCMYVLKRIIISCWVSLDQASFFRTNTKIFFIIFKLSAIKQIGIITFMFINTFYNINYGVYN